MDKIVIILNGVQGETRIETVNFIPMQRDFVIKNEVKYLIEKVEFNFDTKTAYVTGYQYGMPRPL